MIINSLNSTNQTTEITKTKQISSKDDSFDKLVEEKKLNPKEGIKMWITKSFGENSFSNALFEEMKKDITKNTTEKSYADMIGTIIMIHAKINNIDEQINEIRKNGDKDYKFKTKDISNINFIDETRNILTLLKENKITKDIEQKNKYTDLLTKVLDKTIQYENEKNSILNKNSNTPNPFQIKEIA